MTLDWTGYDYLAARLERQAGRQRPGGLPAQARGRAGDHTGPVGQVHTVDDLQGGELSHGVTVPTGRQISTSVPELPW